MANEGNMQMKCERHSNALLTKIELLHLKKSMQKDPCTRKRDKERKRETIEMLFKFLF